MKIIFDQDEQGITGFKSMSINSSGFEYHNKMEPKDGPFSFKMVGTIVITGEDITVETIDNGSLS